MAGKDARQFPYRIRREQAHNHDEEAARKFSPSFIALRVDAFPSSARRFLTHTIDAGRAILTISCPNRTSQFSPSRRHDGIVSASCDYQSAAFRYSCAAHGGATDPHRASACQRIARALFSPIYPCVSGMARGSSWFLAQIGAYMACGWRKMMTSASHTSGLNVG